MVKGLLGRLARDSGYLAPSGFNIALSQYTGLCCDRPPFPYTQKNCMDNTENIKTNEGDAPLNASKSNMGELRTPCSTFSSPEKVGSEEYSASDSEMTELEKQNSESGVLVAKIPSTGEVVGTDAISHASTTADLRDRLQEFKLPKDDKKTGRPKLCGAARKRLSRLLQSGMGKEEALLKCQQPMEVIKELVTSKKRDRSDGSSPKERSSPVKRTRRPVTGKNRAEEYKLKELSATQPVLEEFKPGQPGVGTSGTSKPLYSEVAKTKKNGNNCQKLS